MSDTNRFPREYILRNDYGPDVKFAGHFLANAVEEGDTREVDLFKTKDGLYVAQVRRSLGGTTQQVTTSAYNPDKVWALHQKCGYGPRMKHLYRDAGIPCETEVGVNNV